MNFKSMVPNAITLLNLLSGLLAIIFVINQDYQEAFYAICLGILFDFFDGFAARLLNVSSKLGTELDSLADMVTSGVVPGLVMFYLLLDSLGLSIEQYSFISKFTFIMIIPVLGFAITLGSCYRLAKFNIDERQTESFIGLPTPANCLMIASLPILVIENRFEMVSELLNNTWVLLVITAISTYFLNSDIYLFSLKIKEGDWKKYKLQIVYLVICLVSLGVYQLSSVPFLILLYVFVSLIFPSKKKY